jgi:hypothetical protein
MLRQGFPFQDNQLGAYTGSIADLHRFACLETLIIHSTAILAKGAHVTEIADPTLTLPTSIKNVTVYGAHDELWFWIESVLDNRGTHFPYLSTITLLREEPVKGLYLSRLRDLRETHRHIWEKIQGNSVVLRGDIWI